MALAKCPECGGQVSDAATACPHCGYPMGDVAQAAAMVRQKQHEQRQAGVPLSESEKWFSYQGRLSVGQYWGRILIGVGVFFLLTLAIASQAETPSQADDYEGFVVLAWVLSFWPTSALAWKRAHDTGRSGPTFLLVLIPLIGPIIWFVLSLQGSSPAPNQYGPKPGFKYEDERQDAGSA